MLKLSLCWQKFSTRKYEETLIKIKCNQSKQLCISSPPKKTKNKRERRKRLLYLTKGLDICILIFYKPFEHANMKKRNTFYMYVIYSVERLFSQLVEGQHSALEPLIITRKGVLSVNREFLFDPKALYALFYIHG